jgi:hypothetical protein
MSCTDAPVKICVRRGELDPQRIRLTIDATGVARRVISDLLDILGVSLTMVDRRAGTTETWTTVIVSRTADVAVFDHILQLADTATLRTLHGSIWATVQDAANPVFCGAFDLQVIEP